MMLRASANVNEKEVDLMGIAGDEDAAAVGIPYGREMVAFAEAGMTRDPELLAAARKALLDVAGERVVVESAGVAANFQRMVRIADSTGIPADFRDDNIVSALSLDAFPGSERDGLPAS